MKAQHPANTLGQPADRSASLRQAQDAILGKLHEAQRREEQEQRRLMREEMWEAWQASAPTCVWRWFRGKFVAETVCPAALMWCGALMEELAGEFALARFLAILGLAYIIVMGPGPRHTRKPSDPSLVPQPTPSASRDHRNAVQHQRGINDAVRELPHLSRLTGNATLGKHVDGSDSRKDGGGMSAQKAMLIAACLVAGAILANGYWSRYSLSAAGADGKSVWRIDRRTGRVSVCGALVSGAPLAATVAHEQLPTVDELLGPSPPPPPDFVLDPEPKKPPPKGRGGNADTLRAAGFSEAEIAAYRDEKLTPRCSDWSPS